MVLTRDSARFECRVDGTPAPSVKWNKDWRPISETARVKLKHRSPDHWSLSIDNAKYMDSGQYEVLAENVAGKVYCSAKLTVEGKCELVSSELKNVARKVYLVKLTVEGKCELVSSELKNVPGKVYCLAKLTVEGKCELVSSELKNVAGKVCLVKFS